MNRKIPIGIISLARRNEEKQRKALRKLHARKITLARRAAEERAKEQARKISLLRTAAKQLEKEITRAENIARRGKLTKDEILRQPPADFRRSAL